METSYTIGRPSSSKVAQPALVADAEFAASQDQELATLPAIKLYLKAVCWSLLVSSSLIMMGYDGKLMATFYAEPSFKAAYGTNGSIPASWQSGITNAANAGQMIGLVISGTLSERFGFRMTLIGGFFLICCTLFGYVFASSLSIFVVAQLLTGIPLGIFQGVATVYALELMPTRLRAYLTSYSDFIVAVGQLIAGGITRGTLNVSGSLSYHIPFTLQWLWPIVFGIGVYLAPESPWWLVRHDRLEEAEASVRRLTAGDSNFDVKKNVALMVVTTNLERKMNPNTSYLACFKGHDLRRTIIVMGCNIMEVITGSTLRSYSTYFLEQAGLPTKEAFNMSVIGLSLGVLGVICSWPLMYYVGHRTIFLWGLASSAVLFMIIGGLGVQKLHSPVPAVSWTIGGLLLADTFLADLTVLPLSFSLCSEIPSGILRVKSYVLARLAYFIINIVSAIITPYMLNPTAWNWGAMAGFFWGGTCILGFLFTFFCIPEPKDLTPAEMDVLFERKISARKFKTVKVDFSEIAEGTQ